MKNNGLVSQQKGAVHTPIVNNNGIQCRSAMLLGPFHRDWRWTRHCNRRASVHQSTRFYLQEQEITGAQFRVTQLNSTRTHWKNNRFTIRVGLGSFSQNCHHTPLPARQQKTRHNGRVLCSHKKTRRAGRVMTHF
jgi:hypothetical protein